MAAPHEYHAYVVNEALQPVGVVALRDVIALFVYEPPDTLPMPQRSKKEQGKKDRRGGTEGFYLVDLRWMLLLAWSDLLVVAACVLFGLVG